MYSPAIEASFHSISPELILGNLSRFHRKENLLHLFRCYRAPLTFAVTNNGESDAKVAPPNRGLSPGGSGPLPPIHYSRPPSTLSQNCQNPFLVTSSDLQTICAQLFDSHMSLIPICIRTILQKKINIALKVLAGGSRLEATYLAKWRK